MSVPSDLSISQRRGTFMKETDLEILVIRIGRRLRQQRHEVGGGEAERREKKEGSSCVSQYEGARLKRLMTALPSAYLLYPPSLPREKRGHFATRYMTRLS